MRLADTLNEHDILFLRLLATAKPFSTKAHRVTYPGIRAVFAAAPPFAFAKDFKYYSFWVGRSRSTGAYDNWRKRKLEEMS